MAHFILDIVFIVIFSSYLYWFWGLIRAFTSDAPYVPIQRAVLDRMMQLVPAQGKKIWIDLGSGDGRVVITAVKVFGCQGVGIEKVGALRILSRLNIFRSRLWSRIEIKKGNFFNTDLSRADVVSFYLLPEAGIKIVEKLKKELQPGSLIVFHRYQVPGLPLIAEDTEMKIYVARI